MSLSRVLKSQETAVSAIKVIQLANVSFDQTPGDSMELDPASSSIEEEIRSEQTMQEKYEQLLREFETYKQSVLDQQQRLQEILREETQREQERARQEGFAIGYQEGLERGSDEGLQRYSQQIQESERILQTVKNERVTYLEQNESILIEIATCIAEKILQQHVESNSNYIVPIVRAAIQEIQDVQQVEIRVHPNEYQTVFQDKQTLVTALPGQNELVLIPDAAVAKGGCVIHTAFGSVDARIDSQLNEMKRVLLEATRGTEL